MTDSLRHGWRAARRVWRAARSATSAAVRAVAPRPADDRGSATAELAVSLPALVLLLFTALTAVVAVRTQLECVDAAREAARSAARGDAGVAAGRRVAPSAAVVAVVPEGDVVLATVSVRLHPLGDQGPGFLITATAVAAAEPGVGAGGLGDHSLGAQQ